jgi:hypothetical protein
MRITPLQALLRAEDSPSSEKIMQVTGRGRQTIWRWREGHSYPTRTDVDALIELFGADRLDYNGCYIGSIEVSE